MKTKQFTLLACAALFAAACSKNDNPTDALPENAPKSVTIQLDNNLTRASEPSQSGQKSAVLKTAYILLAKTDGTIVKDGILNENGNPSSFYVDDVADLTSADGVTFHLIPAEVTQIAVVGNVPEATVAAWDNLSDVAAYSRALTEELALWNSTTDAKAVTLYGVCPAAEFEPLEPGTHENYFKAPVKLKPMLARIEIISVQCTDLGTEYSELNIDQFAVAGFNQSAKFNADGTVAGTNPLAAVTGDQMSAYLGATAGASKPAGSFDELSGSPVVIANTTKIEFTPNVYAYNVFPGMAPQIIAGMKDQNGAARYISGTAATALEAGKIYRVECIFDEDQVKTFSNQCVMVVASVQDWEVTALSVSFD